jgi:hypothetical protein
VKSTKKQRAFTLAYQWVSASISIVNDGDHGGSDVPGIGAICMTIAASSQRQPARLGKELPQVSH